MVERHLRRHFRGGVASLYPSKTSQPVLGECFQPLQQLHTAFNHQHVFRLPSACLQEMECHFGYPPQHLFILAPLAAAGAAASAASVAIRRLSSSLLRLNASSRNSALPHSPGAQHQLR